MIVKNVGTPWGTLFASTNQSEEATLNASVATDDPDNGPNDHRYIFPMVI
jgi:hypothetical protein